MPYWARTDRGGAQQRASLRRSVILWGTRDTMVPPADAQRFHADIAGSNLVILPGIGHLAQEEDPEGTLSALRYFLTATPSPPTRPDRLDGP
jgi:pimeloyl-ACP methyl ester carboxylesterase